ncbi:uncharacterized protein LOC124829252 [Vigna umbellata]|uniref:uncharacterized protein LOC124829252 n=1 Tax=Vigna umbellata TaxID=87088 RepID=UPI001F5F5508|nr:uncharacterized protein LOC124829252 [Vigna umbellata]
MGEQETIEGYISRIQVIVNVMRACDKIVKDKKIVHKILRTLTPQYDHIVVAIEESRDLEKMKVEELQNSLEAHKQRLMERKAAEQDTTQNTNQALQVKTYKNRGNNRGRGRSRGGRGGINGGRHNGEQNKDVESNEQGSCRGRGKPKGRGGRKNPDKRNIQCFTCIKYGHYSSECWHNENVKKDHNDEVNLAKEELESESDHVILMTIVVDRRKNDKCVMAYGDFFQNTTSVKNDKWPRNATQAEQVSLTGEIDHAREDMSWYLDIECSNHMTGNKRWIIDLDTSVKSVVRFVDDSIIRAEGLGKVLITRKDGKSVFMHNVLYVPTMKSNLLSLGQLLEKGYTMNLCEKNIEVYDEKQRLIIKAPLARNRTFKVNLNVVEV